MCRLLLSSMLIVIFLLVTTASSNEESAFPEVHKCCAVDEVLLGEHCVLSNATIHDPWKPNIKTGYNLRVGQPRCGSTQLWDVYNGTHDFLVLQQNGKLRHYTRSHVPERFLHDVRYQRREDSVSDNDGLMRHIDALSLEEDGDWFYYDYVPGTYCLDKRLVNDRAMAQQYAAICVPAPASTWNETEVIVQRIVDPVCHGLAIACYLFVAVLYFVLPQLRDLVGNMLTSLSLCLIVSQAAGIIRITTASGNYISLLIVDTVTYISLLAAFLWLNSIGYYIWKTFRSRNVFLRVTDGRKYCYYSGYTWGTTAAIAATALFANFLLDTRKLRTPSKSSIMQERIGWLGIAVFFTAVAFTILVNIFFYLTTGQAISRISTYGRIHHKMKYSFDMFVKLFLVMSVAWLFLLLSWLGYEALIYCNIIVNTLQAFFFLYITVCGQKRVTSLIRKTCCSVPEPSDTAEWGEEMSPMSSSHY